MFERLDLYMKTNCTETSEEMQGYKRFKQLRAHTLEIFISKLS